MSRLIMTSHGLILHDDTYEEFNEKSYNDTIRQKINDDELSASDVLIVDDSNVFLYGDCEPIVFKTPNRIIVPNNYILYSKLREYHYNYYIKMDEDALASPDTYHMRSGFMTDDVYTTYNGATSTNSSTDDSNVSSEE